MPIWMNLFYYDIHSFMYPIKMDGGAGCLYPCDHYTLLVLFLHQYKWINMTLTFCSMTSNYCKSPKSWHSPGSATYLVSFGVSN